MEQLDSGFICEHELTTGSDNVAIGYHALQQVDLGPFRCPIWNIECGPDNCKCWENEQERRKNSIGGII